MSLNEEQPLLKFVKVRKKEAAEATSKSNFMTIIPIFRLSYQPHYHWLELVTCS